MGAEKVKKIESKPCPKCLADPESRSRTRYVCTARCGKGGAGHPIEDAFQAAVEQTHLQEFTTTPEKPAKRDAVHRPNHYTRFEIEPIYFIMKNKLPFAVGNVIKYVCRHDAKDGVQDLKKARRYLDMMIKQAEGDERFAE